MWFTFTCLIKSIPFVCYCRECWCAMIETHYITLHYFLALFLSFYNFLFTANFDLESCSFCLIFLAQRIQIHNILDMYICTHSQRYNYKICKYHAFFFMKKINPVNDWKILFKWDSNFCNLFLREYIRLAHCKII